MTASHWSTLTVGSHYLVSCNRTYQGMTVVGYRQEIRPQCPLLVFLRSPLDVGCYRRHPALHDTSQVKANDKGVVVKQSSGLDQVK